MMTSDYSLKVSHEIFMDKIVTNRLQELEGTVDNHVSHLPLRWHHLLKATQLISVRVGICTWPLSVLQALLPSLSSPWLLGVVRWNPNSTRDSVLPKRSPVACATVLSLALNSSTSINNSDEAKDNCLSTVQITQGCVGRPICRNHRIGIQIISTGRND